MLTPTGITASDYWNAIKDGHFTHIRMTFTGQSIVLDDSDIHSNGFTLTDILNGETDLVFGYAVSKQFTVSILNSSKLNNLDWTGEFTLEMGVEVGNPVTINYVQIGIFSGEKPNNVTIAEVIQFTAYDRMKKFDVFADDYYNSITYPITIQNIYNGLCTFVGVSNVSGDELATIMTRSYDSAPFDMQGYTCRDLLAMIAEACGCYAKIAASGNCKMVWFSDQTSYAIEETEEYNVETVDASNAVNAIDQLKIKQLSSDMDILYPDNITGTNVYMIVDNPFLTVSEASEITSYIKPIFDRLDAFGGYKPIKLDCIGNWLVEAGDIITVEANGDDITVPIFTRTMMWNGATNDSYEATGQTNRTVVSSKDQEKILNANEIKLLVRNKYDVVSGIVIDSNGVSINGNKYIHLSASDNSTKWTIDDKGLSFYNNNTESNEIQFGGQFDSQELNTEAGIYAYKPSGDTTHGRLAFVATNMETDKYSYSILEFDSNLYLYPFLDNGMCLGKQDKRIYVLYINDYIIATHYQFDSLRFCPKTNGGYGLGYTNYRFTSIYANELYGDLDNGYLNIYMKNSSSCIRLEDDVSYGGKFHIRGHGTYNDWEVVLHGSLGSVSSREKKHDIKQINDVGEKIDKLSPVSFVYNNDKFNRTRFGLIYEEVIDVIPEICSETKKKESDKVEKELNYVELIPLLVSEIKNLRKRVAELERKVNG